MPTGNTVPIYNPQAAWQIWNWNDIFTGPTGTGQYVPKVGDVVYQIENSTKTEYVCRAVNTQTFLSDLAVINNTTLDGTFNMSTLFGVGPGTQADTYRVYIDKSVTPYRMGCDGRLSIAGSLVAYVKFFAGTDISPEGAVISQVYDSSGVFIGENVALEQVGVWQGNALVDNTAIKVPKTCYTQAELADGDIITCVAYDTAGFVVSKRQLLVENTGFVRGLDASAKEVVSIGLLTPFLAAPNSTKINFPVNVPVVAMNLVGVVSYSDGSTVEYAVDGTKFSVAGLDAYAPTIVGQSVPIVLKYQLQPGESAYGMNNTNSDHVSAAYTIETQAVDGNYQVQLYCYPEWINHISGYAIRWYMYDLNRSQVTDVTAYVTIDPSRGPIFNPTLYGAKQTLYVYLNLQDVNVIYNRFYHVQIVDIVLNNPASTRPAINGLPDWQVTQQAGQVPLFGPGVHARCYSQNLNSNQLNLQGDFTGDYTGWLNAYYRLTRPLFNPSTETSAPDPTHFAIFAGNFRTEYPLSQWNQLIVLTQPLTNNSTIYLQFFKRTAQADLQLSVAGIPLWMTDVNGNYI